MFDIRDLRVYADGKEIVKGVSLSLDYGKVYALMGPNGSGKSSLCNALMGDPAFTVKGSMRLDGRELGRLKPDERARAGLFLAFQNPEELEGVKAGGLVRKARAAGREESQDLDALVREHEQVVKTAESLGMDKSMVERELNVGFSGGEKKRMEVLQMVELKPRIILLDEIDSGLDVDGVRLIARAIKKLDDASRAILIITHYPRLLKYIKPDVVHVMVKGRIVKSGNSSLAREIGKKGYSPYARGKKERD